jgi:hypothetical protein
MIVKRCKGCKEDLDESCFGKCKAVKSGLKPRCNACYAEETRLYRLTDRSKAVTKSYRSSESTKKYMRDYAIENKDSIALAQKKHSESHPYAAKARRMVNNKLRYNKITKPNRCEVCNSVKPLQAHRDSYEKSRWLDITWMCIGCHTDWHKCNKPYHPPIGDNHEQ